MYCLTLYTLLRTISGYDAYIFPDSVEAQWKILDSIGSHL